MLDLLMDEVIELLQRANAEFSPEVLTADAARKELASCAHARRLIDFRIAGLSRKLGDLGELAQVTGTSVGRRKRWWPPARRWRSPKS